MNHRDRNSAFTLVQMLVVIFILGLLLSMLLPVISKARQNANVVKCAANLHQLGQLLGEYRLANHDQFPLASMPAPLKLHDRSPYPPSSQADLDFIEGLPPLYDTLKAFVAANSGIYRCPFDNTQVYERCAAYSPQHLGISYFFRNFYKSRTPGSASILMWDYRSNGIPTVYKGHVPPIHPDAKINYLFLDGHVDCRKDNSITVNE